MGGGAKLLHKKEVGLESGTENAADEFPLQAAPSLYGYTRTSKPVAALETKALSADPWKYDEGSAVAFVEHTPLLTARSA